MSQQYNDRMMTAASSPANHGTITRWSERGFGFIARDDGGPEHIRNVAGRAELKPGDRVGFDVGDHHGRPEARNVHLVEAQ